MAMNALATHSPAALLERVAVKFFPYQLDVDREQRKVDIARVATGFFAIVRFGQIFQASFLLNGQEGSHMPLAIALLVSALFVTIGLLTPLSCAALAFLMRCADNVYSTNTLGTTILIQLLLVLLLARAGTNFSVDRWLAPHSKLLQRFYSKPLRAELKCVYAFALIAYGVVSAAALWFHVRDPYWTHGLTVKSMMVNSYLCKHWDMFRYIDSHWPVEFGALSIASGVVQSVFQFLMIPLMFLRVGRFFVRWHGFLFFFVSLIFLNLSFLPHYELLLWWVILFPARMNPSMDEALDRWCGRCSLPSLAMWFYLSYAVMMFIFVAAIRWNTYDNNGPQSTLRSYAIAAYRTAGLEVPIVFDVADLKMGNRWALINRAGPDGELTPLTGPDGQKGNYWGHDAFWAGNHNSDLLYFGTTLPFRRQIIDMPVPRLNAYISQGKGRDFIQREIAYDYRRRNLSGTVRYRLVVMQNAASEVSLFASSIERLQPRAILYRWYRYDGNQFK